MCSSLVVSIFTLLCYQSPELFHLAKLKLRTHHPMTPTPLGPRAFGNHHVTSCLCDLIQTHHISGLLQYLSFCYWLISLNVTSSMFTQVVACDRIPLFFKAECYSIMCVSPFCFSTHLSVDTGCFHLEKLILIVIRACFSGFWIF